MNLYHYVWLLTHPDRSEEWLRERLDDGFHIHHLDGNHYNNDPKNLVLIEGTDHFRLHGRKGGKSNRKRSRLDEVSVGIQKRTAKAHREQAIALLQKMRAEDEDEMSLIDYLLDKARR